MRDEELPETPRYRLSEYDKKRLEEMKGGNLALFWLAFPVVVIGGGWLLIQIADWWSSW
jgi:hypothetical protein